MYRSGFGKNTSRQHSHNVATYLPRRLTKNAERIMLRIVVKHHVSVIHLWFVKQTAKHITSLMLRVC